MDSFLSPPKNLCANFGIYFISGPGFLSFRINQVIYGLLPGMASAGLMVLNLLIMFMFPEIQLHFHILMPGTFVLTRRTLYGLRQDLLPDIITKLTILLSIHQNPEISPLQTMYFHLPPITRGTSLLMEMMIMHIV